jgi:hypothetical protein
LYIVFLNDSNEPWWSDFDIQKSQVMLQLVPILEKKENNLEPLVIINGNKTGWNKGDKVKN